MCMTSRRQFGFTLIEMIAFIVVVGVGVAGILSVMNITVKSSADPLMRKQPLAIADAMLCEILLRPYPAVPAGTSRLNWTVRQYNGYSAVGIKDVNGVNVPGLGNYTVAVAVATVTAADSLLFNLTGTVPFKVTVTVTAPNGKTISLTGYRASY